MKNTIILISLCFSFIYCISCTQESSSDQNSNTSPAKTKPKPFVLSGNPNQISLKNNAVVMMGGFNIIDDVNQQIKTVSQQLVQSIDLKSMWLDNFVKKELLLPPSQVNGKRPLRFLQILKDQELHRVYLIGLHQPKDFITQLGEFTQKLTLGELTVFQRGRFKEDRDPLYFHLIGDLLLVSRKKELLATSFHTLYKSLYLARFEGIGGIHTYPEKLLDLWQGDANTHLQKQLDQWELKGDEASQKRQKSMLLEASNWAQNLALQSDRVKVNFLLTQSHMQFKLSWQAKNQSDLAQWIDNLAQNEHPLLKYLPSKVPFLMSLNLKTEQLQKLFSYMNQSLLTRNLLNNNDDLLQQYLTAVTQASQQLQGQILLAASQHKLPSKLSQKKQQESADTKAKMVAPADPNLFMSASNPYRLQWQALFTHQKQELMSKSLNEIFSFYGKKSFKKILKRNRLWFKLSYDKAVEGVKPISIRARMPRPPKILRPIKAQLRELYHSHLVLTPEVSLMTFGDSWEDMLRHYLKIPSFQSKIDHAANQAIEQKSEAPSLSLDPGIQNALKIAAPNPFFLAYLEPISFISSLKQGKSGSMLLPLQMMLHGIQATEGLALSLGSQKQQVHGIFSIPVESIKKLTSAFTGQVSN